jgi:hypothetical protein
MKHGSIKAVCFAVMACIAVLSAYGDEMTVDLTSIVLESFNGETTHEWNDGRHPRQFEFSWALGASKFASKTTDADGNEVQFPRSTYVEAWPVALFGFRQPEGITLKSLGINGRFDRRGYNWIDVYPTNGDGDPYEIPMPGRVRYLDLWVWGSNLNSYVEAYMRDLNGIVHTIQLGNITFTGWKNLRASVPNHIRQARRVQPNLAQLKFVKFRIWTQPQEDVGNFYVYLKQFKILTDTFESFYDGDELADPDRVPQLWADNSANQ